MSNPSFTGFWEARSPSTGLELATTVSYWPVPRLLKALGTRLEAAEPGTHVRIDLIAWDEPEAGGAPPVPKLLMLDDDELDALWKLLAGGGVDPALRGRVLGRVQRLVEDEE